MTNAVTLTNQYTLLLGAEAYSTVETINSHSYGAAVFAPANQFNVQITVAVPRFASVLDAGTGHYGAAILFAAGGTVINDGYIIANSQNGIQLQAGGSVTNTGTINVGHSNQGAIGIDLTAGYVLNAGDITTPGLGVNALTGTVKNLGLIATGTNAGIGIVLLDGGAVFNTGTITGAQGILMRDNLNAPDYISNRGTIAVKTLAEYLGKNALALNAGIISSGLDAIDLTASGTILNTGQISASRNAISAAAYLSLANAGTISGIITATGNANLNNFGIIAGPVEFGAGHVFNTGLIENSGLDKSAGSFGVELVLGGTLTNTGEIRAALGIEAAGALVIDNQSTIIAYTAYGALLLGGGAVTNTGYIHAAMDGITANSPAAIINNGIISATNFDGILLRSGGNVTNTGTVCGVTGIGMTNLGTIKINNAGLIEAAAAGSGIFLVDGGDVVNSGTIIGGQGVHLGNGPTATVINTSTIIATSLDGIFLAGTGTVTNTRLIQAYTDGVYLESGGLLTNSGQILAAGASAYYGIDLAKSGTIINTGSIASGTGIFARAGATITNGPAGAITGTLNQAIYVAGAADITNQGRILGQTTAIAVGAGSTIANAGFIIADTTAISFATGAANRLIITAASTITGAVDGGTGILELAASAATATFTAAEATQFTGFTTIQIDAGAVWALGNGVTLGATEALVNNGILKKPYNAVVTIDSAITGTGAINLSKGTLTLNNAVAGGENLSFSGTSETLALSDPQNFAAKIKHFTLGDTIDLTGLSLSAITATHFVHSVLTIEAGATDLYFTFASPAAFAHQTFALSTIGVGTAITLAAHLPLTHTQAPVPAPLMTLGS